VAGAAAVRDVEAMDLDSLARLLARGARGASEGARAEARRVLDVLVERGDLSRAEADEIEAAVAQAADTHRRWIDESVLAPLGRTLRGFTGAGATGLDARLAKLEERLARIEQWLAERSEPKP
jgi:polyhydroxyalkanoate synthesis regulator phasin